MIQNTLSRPNEVSSWGYGPTNGPDTWGNIWPIAIEGKSQSPISLSWAAPEDPSLNERRLMVR
jgi:carbonic anhydrase